jgi:hypothetical protein
VKDTVTSAKVLSSVHFFRYFSVILVIMCCSTVIGLPLLDPYSGDNIVLPFASKKNTILYRSQLAIDDAVHTALIIVLGPEIEHVTNTDNVDAWILRSGLPLAGPGIGEVCKINPQEARIYHARHSFPLGTAEPEHVGHPPAGQPLYRTLL